MKALRSIYFIFAAVAVFTFALSGCLDDASIALNKGLPLTDGKSDTDLPRITDGALDILENYSNTAPVTVTTFSHRLPLTFSEEMDPDTINTTNIYVRDVNAAPTLITGQTVTLSKDSTVAWIDWTSSINYTTRMLEVVVTTNVRDRSGNRIAGLVEHHGNTYPWNEMVAEFRRDVTGATAWTAAPNWQLATLTITTANPSATTVNVTVTFNTANILASTITQANFTTTSGSIGNYVDTNLNTTGVITFDITTPTANAESRISFDPVGVIIDPATAGGVRRYPDGVTTLTTLTAGYITPAGVESVNEVVDNAAKGKFSKFAKRFVPDLDTATLDPVTVSNDDDWTSVFYSGVGSDKVIEIEFSEPMNGETFIEDNFIVIDDDEGIPVLFTVEPFYLTGDTSLVRALISTMDYSQHSIDQIIIKTGVRSAAGVHIDGNGDGEQDGEGDYNEDGIIDDWYEVW